MTQAVCPGCGTVWQIPVQMSGPVHCSHCQGDFWPQVETTTPPQATESAPAEATQSWLAWNQNRGRLILGTAAVLVVLGLGTMAWMQGAARPPVETGPTIKRIAAGPETIQEPNTTPKAAQSLLAEGPQVDRGHNKPASAPQPASDSPFTEIPLDPRPPEFPVARSILPEGVPEVDEARQQSVAGQIVEVDAKQQRFWLGLLPTLAADTQAAIRKHNESSSRPALNLPPGILPPGIGLPGVGLPAGIGLPGNSLPNVGAMSYSRVDPTLARFARFNNNWWGTSSLPVDIWESGRWRLLGRPGLEEDRIPRTFYFDASRFPNLETGQVVRLTVAPRVPLWRGVQVLAVEAFRPGAVATENRPAVGGIELVSPSSADKPLEEITGETVVVGKIIGFDLATSTFSLAAAEAYGVLSKNAHYIRAQDWQRLPDFQFDLRTAGREALAEMKPVELLCRPQPGTSNRVYVMQARAINEQVKAYATPGMGQQLDDGEALKGHLLKARRMLRLGRARETIQALEAGSAFAQTNFWGRYLPEDIDIRPVVESLAQRDSAAAVAAARQAVSIAEALLPADHWVVVDARQSLAYVKRLDAATPAERLELARSKTLRHQAAAFCREAQFRPALAALEEAVAIRASFLGPDHALHAVGLNDLARLQVWLGDWTAAEKSLDECLQLRQRNLGRRHPATLVSRINLIRMYDVRNQWAKAAPLVPETLEGLKALQQDVGQDELPAQVSVEQGAIFFNRCRMTPPVAFSDGKDFLIFERATFPANFRPGQPVRAAQAFQAGLAGDHPLWLPHFGVHAKGLFGPPDGLPQQFASLGRISGISMLSWEQEQQMIDRWVPDEGRAAADTQVGAVLQNDLARLRQTLELTDGAVELRQAAERIARQGVRPGQISAELLARQVGARHGMNLSSGPIFELLGILHPEPFSSRLGHEEGVPLALAGVLPAHTAYARVLSAKGAIFSLQQSRRQLSATGSPAASAVPLGEPLAELRQVTQHLAALAYDIPPPAAREAWRQKLGSWAARRELLEAQLGGLEFCQRQAQQEAVDPEQIRRALPPGTALVDFVTFLPELPWGEKVSLVEQALKTLRTDGVSDDLRTIAAGYWPTGEAQRRRHLAAVIVRPDYPFAWIDLGPLAPVQQQIDAWLARYSRGPELQPASGPLPETVLRRQLWEPLEPALRGAKVVLLSPEEHLARFPFAALPGATPGRYLIEERALAVLPTPQLLTKWVAETPPATPSGPPMLLVGGVDFDAAQGPRPADSPLAGQKRGMFQFGPLPGTVEEINELERLYQGTFGGAPNTLRGREATERALRDALPAQRIVHLATHGFFAPPELKAALFETTPESAGGRAVLVASGERLCDRRARAVRFHPGLLSGLAAAGINRARSADDSPLDDGLLTAVEVADLDLRGADLVVLSACQSALGEPADGEGLLGLQRAFQVAGARSVMSSLWEVDDRATQLLMVEFYRNLWQKKLGKLDSLRLAQLHMLRHYDPASGQLRGVGGVRPPLATTAGTARLSPFYWAAFQMAGDWR